MSNSHERTTQPNGGLCMITPKICLIGAPGVGKSAVYRDLTAIPVSRRNFLTKAEALERIALQRASSGGIRSFIARVELSLYFAAALKRRGKAYLLRHAYREGQRRMRGPYAPLLDATYRSLADEVADPLQRLMASAFLLKIAKEEMLIDSHAPGFPVLLDDSVWQSLRGFSAGNVPLHGGDLPLPALVVFFTAERETIIERIARRKELGKVNNAHAGVSEAELRKIVDADAENAMGKAEFLRRLGVTVVDVDAQRAPSETAAYVRDHLNKMTISLGA